LEDFFLNWLVDDCSAVCFAWFGAAADDQLFALPGAAA